MNGPQFTSPRDPPSAKHVRRARPPGQPVLISIDSLELLLHANVGPLYHKIETNDPERRLFGYIPAMARSSLGQIGALTAEFFCERILRCAGHVLMEGNTLLKRRRSCASSSYYG